MQASGSSAGAKTALHSIVVGGLCGLLAIVQSIGFGSLLGGESATLSHAAIGMALFSTTIVAAITPLFSSTHGVIAIAQGIPAVALAAIVAQVTLATAGAPERVMLATAVVTVAVATVFIGVSSLLLGRFKLGRFIRFVPYPVIGGFLAGSGWLILRGGVELVAGAPILTMAAEADGAMLLKGAVAAVFLAVLAGLMQVSSNRLVLPATVAGALLLLNGATWFAGVPAEILRESRWLLSVPSGSLWPPIAPGEIALADIGTVLGAMIAMPSVAVLTILALLMSATGIELDARHDIDVDSELTSMGVANLVAGIGGAMPGYHSVTLTILASRLGARTLLVGLTVAAICGGALAFGDAVLSVMPTPLLGAMLIWIGGALIVQWLVQSYRRLPVREYLVIVLIFVAIAFAGFAWGIFVGLIAAVLLFAVEYGQVDIVRLLVTGRDYHSSVDTSEQRRQTLLDHGDAILIIRLQGFLFFGTADRLRRRVEARVTGNDDPRTRFVVIDFRRVTGLDSSTVLSFVRLSQAAAREGFTVVLTGVAEATRAALVRGGLSLGENGPVRLIPDFDSGIKWCEDRLLSETAPDLAAQRAHPLALRLTDILEDPDFAAHVATYCERVEVASGTLLITEGTPSDDIFFVESGHAAVAMVSDRPTPLRLATVGPGAIVGEIAFYLGEPRTASVVAEEPMVVWRFSRDSLRRLQADMPEVALRFHQGIAAMLAKRLTRTNHLVRLLAD